MKAIFAALAAALCICLFPSCEKATPEQAFARAVINTNLTNGFAGKGMRYELENPSAVLDPAGGTTIQKRKNLVDGKILSIEESYRKTKAIPETDDNRGMLQASIALYEYVLPVYRNEYGKLAALYDKGADAAELEAAYKDIADKYLKGYEEKSAALLAAGKPFAERHGIKVQWGVQTSPSP